LFSGYIDEGPMFFNKLAEGQALFTCQLICFLLLV
jgi:hypothetical protein